MRPARAALALGVLALLAAAGAAQDTDDSGSRGQKMYGDPCTTEEDCLLMNSICDPILKQCVCDPSTPATNHFDKCGKALNINESCTFNEQCSETTLKTECKNGRCTCIYELVPVKTAEGYSCVGETYVEESIRTFDPAMIGVLVGMALMFVIICVVLRLFSKARWSENRTIFNTPNPRLMNVSLLRESKLDRRGSRISMRPPSRQTSQQDLRPHSPGSRRGSKASSGHSASSPRSATLRSPTMTCPTSVTVEIRAPE